MNIREEIRNSHFKGIVLFKKANASSIGVTEVSFVSSPV